MAERMFANRTVVVSGAASGVGRSVVAKLAAQGARICATDITGAVELLAADTDAEIVPIVADLTRAEQVERVYAVTEARFGAVDALVSNAGFIISKSVLETSEAEWDSVMNANAKSFFLMAKRAFPSMLARKSGTIVATGSISSVVGLASQAAYCASKGALLGV